MIDLNTSEKAAADPSSSRQQWRLMRSSI